MLATQRRSRRWWLLGAGALAVVVAYRCLPPSPLPAHEGDGEFADISWRASACGLSLFNVRGFAVSMPRFELGHDHSAEYRVRHLPDIGRPCKLYLAIDDPQNRWFMRDDDIHRLDGSLTLEVIDAAGECICHEEGPLNGYVWGNWLGAHRLYQIDALSFPVRPSQEYTVRLVYRADPALVGYQGYCYLQCGGRL